MKKSETKSTRVYFDLKNSTKVYNSHDMFIVTDIGGKLKGWSAIFFRGLSVDGLKETIDKKPPEDI